jgi:hypothetical protein
VPDEEVHASGGGARGDRDAHSSGGHAQLPAQDIVVGSDDVFIPAPRLPFPPGVFHLFGFDFNAASGPAGENPTGQLSPLTFGERLGLMVFTGNVTCLAVSGNRAAIGAARSSSGFAVQGQCKNGAGATSPSSRTRDSAWRS